MKYDSRLHERRRRLLHAFGEGGGDIIRSIFADGTDGFYFDFSKTDRLFQNLTGTPADGAGENIYLGLEGSKWAGRTLAQQLADASPVLFDDFSTYADTAALQAAWTRRDVTNTLLTLSSAAMRVENNTTTSEWVSRTFTTVAGQRYRLQGTLSDKGANSPRAMVGTSNNNTNLGSTDRTATGAFSLDFAATGTTTYVTLNSSSTTAGHFAVWDDIRIVPVAGNHGLQATTAAQPKWQAGGLARFDGSDDNLLTTLTPGAAMTLMAKFKPSAANAIVVGTSDGSGRAYLSIDAAGLVSGGVGSQSNSVIKGGSSVTGSTGVAALAYDASNVALYWNNTVIYSGAKAGPIPASAILLGSLSSSSFMNGDIYRALAIKKALTAAEIAAITNLWGTT